MRIVMLGPPGSGKGTQGIRLARRLGVVHVSTGDMLREARSAASDLGRRAGAHMDRGDLVPDDVMVGIVGERLGRPDCSGGFVLDGFPRTVGQAEALDATLGTQGRRLAHVVALDVSRDEIRQRLAARRTCASCGRPWAAEDPQTRTARCACGGDLVVRDDDRPESVERRLDVYVRATAPLLAWYARAGLLRNVDGAGDVEAVADRILATMAMVAS